MAEAGMRHKITGDAYVLVHLLSFADLRDMESFTCSNIEILNHMHAAMVHAGHETAAAFVQERERRLTIDNAAMRSRDNPTYASLDDGAFAAWEAEDAERRAQATRDNRDNPSSRNNPTVSSSDDEKEFAARG